MVVELDFDDVLTETSTSQIDRQFWEYFENEGPNPNASLGSQHGTLQPDLEVELRGSQGPILATYAVLFAVGAFGNVAVLVALTKSRRRKSRVDLLMTHLALADVCVTCGVIPLEIGWKYTNAWLAGNALCKALLVLRAFGLYLSSNVLVCISIDRFFAVLYPLRLPVARRRSKRMLWTAWAAAIACSLPQSAVFRVMRHPQVPGFKQCVSFGAFSSARQEVVYNAFCLGAMYFLPLLLITGCYISIFCEIRRNATEIDEKSTRAERGLSHVRLRRSDRRTLERARRRTLRMTVTIVSVFALCWLPYATMAIWYMVDRWSATRVSPRVQDLLFAMAVSNSCMNPLVYGSYVLDLRGALRRLLRNACCCSSDNSDSIGNSSSSTKNKNHNLEEPLIIKNGRMKPRLGVRFAETSLTAVVEPSRPPRSTPSQPRAPA